jgi:hypothetical protein
MEYWSTGVVEWWNKQNSLRVKILSNHLRSVRNTQAMSNPILQYSNTPMLRAART